MKRFMTGAYAGRAACKQAAGRLYHRKYGGTMPSSKDRRRLEVPKYLHEQLEQIATRESRTIASVAGPRVGAAGPQSASARCGRGSTPRPWTCGYRALAPRFGT